MAEPRLSHARPGRSRSAQEFGCALLQALLAGDEDVRGLVACAGGIEAAVAAATAHPAHAGVQQAASKLLGNLSYDALFDSATFANRWRAEALLTTGADSKIPLQQQAGNKANQARSGAAGAVEVLVRALLLHAQDRGVQEAACGALQNLTYDSGNAERREHLSQLPRLPLAVPARGPAPHALRLH